MTLQGHTAVVTGASSGIGAAFADALARRKADLVLVARSTPVLEQAAARLRAEHSVRVDVLACDLVADAAVASLCERIEALGVTVDVLVNNAGFATQGRFETIPAQRDRDQVRWSPAAAERSSTSPPLVAFSQLRISPFMAPARRSCCPLARRSPASCAAAASGCSRCAPARSTRPSLRSWALATPRSANSSAPKR